jgi:hypothetical protein
MSNLTHFKNLALARADVKKAYDDLSVEFALLDELLKVHTTPDAIQSGSSSMLDTLPPFPAPRL